MSRRNRIVLTAFGLLAVLSLTAPASSQAVGLRESGIPLAETLEKVWNWLTGQPPGAKPQAFSDSVSCQRSPAGPAAAVTSSQEGFTDSNLETLVSGQYTISI